MLTCPGLFIKERIICPGQSLGVKNNQSSHIDKRECEKFEMALQHKAKLCAQRGLKWEVGFEENLEYTKGAPSRLFLSPVQVLMGLCEVGQV